MTSQFTKDPNSVLDYKFSWASWLATGETIASKTVTVSPTGLTADSSTITDTNTSVTVWLSGGTAGKTYDVACKIVTSASRTDERTMRIVVENR